MVSCLQCTANSSSGVAATECTCAAGFHDLHNTVDDADGRCNERDCECVAATCSNGDVNESHESCQCRRNFFGGGLHEVGSEYPFVFSLPRRDMQL